METVYHYNTVRKILQNVVIPLNSAARDVVNGWWKAVDSQHVTDPNILCLSRNWDEYDIGDEDDMPIEIAKGMEIFLRPLNKTSPEVVTVAITWDGFDAKGVTPIGLTIYQDIHREEPRSYLLRRWIEHFKTKPEYAEIASRPFTDDNKYYWTDQSKSEASPPWQPGQQVSFKLKPQ